MYVWLMDENKDLSIVYFFDFFDLEMILSSLPNHQSHHHHQYLFFSFLQKLNHQQNKERGIIRIILKRDKIPKVIKIELRDEIEIISSSLFFFFCFDFLFFFRN